VSILDDNGLPMLGSGKGGVATFDDLAKEVTQEFPSMFAAAGAEGGGKTITRGDFDALNPTQRAEKIKAGFRIVEGPDGKSPTRTRVGPTIKRTEFDSLSHMDRMSKIREGTRVVD
jgi:hypothetical protein